MNRRGFTVVEVTITIVVMAILAALVIAGLRQTSISSRNDKRKANAEILVRGLETYYGKADNRYSTTNRPNNRYPSSSDVLHAMGWEQDGYNPRQVTGGYQDAFLNGVSKDLVNRIRLMWFINNTVVQPDNSTDVLNDTGVALDDIVYQPLAYTPQDFYGSDRIDNCNVGTQVCTNFNVYYKQENYDGSTTVKVIRSKHQ